MKFLPVETFDHIIVDARSKAWAVYELNGPDGLSSYRFQSEAELVAHGQQILSWVQALPREARLLSVACPIHPDDLATAVAEAPSLTRYPTASLRRAMSDQAYRAADLAGQRPAHQRRHFLCVTLDDTDTVRAGLFDAFVQLGAAVEGTRAASSPGRRRELLAAAELTATALGPLVRPADQLDVRWLYQRATRRGLPQEPGDPAIRQRSRRRRTRRSVSSGSSVPTDITGRANGAETTDGADKANRSRSSRSEGFIHSVRSRPLLDAVLFEGRRGEREDSDRSANGLTGADRRRRGGSDGGGRGLRGRLGRRFLRVESSVGCSWQATLVLASMPSDWVFPDQGFWLAAADDFDFPIDVIMRVLSPPQHETKRKLRRRHKELVSQPSQYSGTTTGVPDSVLDLIDRSNAAQTALDSSRLSRLHRTLTCFTIAADSPEELERRVTEVQAEFGAGGFELHSPTGEQTDLFHLGLPGTVTRPGGVVVDYDLDLTAEAIASGLPGFTPALGDPSGALLGHRVDVGPPMPVLLTPSTATSASTMGFGASGSGKSFAAKTIALQELTAGAQVVAIDRSNGGEYVKFAAGLPAYLTSEIVDLSGDSQHSLCPLSTFPSSDRVEVTTSFLCLLAGVGARTVESARLAEATESVARDGGTTADVLSLLDYWGSGQGGTPDPLSRDLYYRISPLARTRFASLAFRPGAGISVEGADLIVLHARGMVLPSREEVRRGEDLDASKAAAIAMVYLLMALADAVGNNPNRLSSIVLDEAWAFLDSSFGIELANRVLRDGRKDFKKLQLWSQHPTDAPPELLNMASNVFLTRQVEGAGAAALGLVGAQPTADLIALVEQLAVGEAVMRDEYGRLGVLRIAPPADPRVANSFDTRPAAGASGKVRNPEPSDFGASDIASTPGRVLEDPWTPAQPAPRSEPRSETPPDPRSEMLPAPRSETHPDPRSETGPAPRRKARRSEPTSDLFARLEADIRKLESQCSDAE